MKKLSKLLIKPKQSNAFKYLFSTKLTKELDPKNSVIRIAVLMKKIAKKI